MQLSPHRLFIPLLVSFSLSGAGVILIYFLNKKKSDKDKSANKKAQYSREIIIPSQFIPAVIGRYGSVLSDIKQNTNTRIVFKEEKKVDLPERICIITGDLENVKLAEQKIQYIINNQPIIETYETWIPQRSINSLSERGGELINVIQNTSGAKIILERSLITTDPNCRKRVIIKGTAEQIANALLQIEDQVRGDNDLIEAEKSPLKRSPRIKNIPPTISDNNLKYSNYSKEIFGEDARDGLLPVFISAVENPSQFYIQVIGPTNKKLDDLVRDMTDYYEHEENREIHVLKTLSAGQIVAAKFEDGKWYRAEIINHLGNKIYDVYFVDFGDRDKIKITDILELRTDFLSLRQQAVEVSLAGVKPCAGEWSVEAILEFSKLSALAQWQPRVAKIRGYKERSISCGSRREGSPIPCIELYEKHDDQLLNIGKELIGKELACAESEPWSAASSTLSISRSTLVDPRTKSPESPESAGSPESLECLGAMPKDNGLDRKDDASLLPQSQRVQHEPKPNDSKIDSRSFIENERSTPGKFNGHVQKSSQSLPANPFKREKKVLPMNIMPAGYESEFSDDSDEFEIN